MHVSSLRYLVYALYTYTIVKMLPLSPRSTRKSTRITSLTTSASRYLKACLESAMEVRYDGAANKWSEVDINTTYSSSSSCADVPFAPGLFSSNAYTTAACLTGLKYPLEHTGCCNFFFSSQSASNV